MASAERKLVALNIDGMSCASCVSSVKSALEAVSGVQKADVNLSTEQAHVLCARSPAAGGDVEVGFGTLVSDNALCSAVESVGFGASVFSVELLRSSTAPVSGGQVVLALEGLTCASCVATVSSALLALDCVNDVSVNLSTETATVMVSPGLALGDECVSRLVSAVEVLGFGAHELSRTPLQRPHPAKLHEAYESAQEQRSRLLDRHDDDGTTDAAASVESLGDRQAANVARWRNRCVTAGIFAVPNLVVTMLLPLVARDVHTVLMRSAFGVQGLSWMAVIGAVLASPVQFGSAIPFYRKAYKAACNKVFGMDFLVVVGTSGEYK